MTTQELIAEYKHLLKVIRNCPPLNQAVDDTELICRAELEDVAKELLGRGVALPGAEE